MPESALLLSAGYGTRLRPLTNSWPKCLMPIHGIPLMEYWLANLRQAGVSRVHVNTHHHDLVVTDFLQREVFKDFISIHHEPSLLGTAGTIRKVFHDRPQEPVVVIHADNWTFVNLLDVVNFHIKVRQPSTAMTMVTFRCNDPRKFGIVRCNKLGIVDNFFEKQEVFHGNIANSAVYIFDPSVISWVSKNQNVTDISIEVLPKFVGRIQAFFYDGIHRDIGTPPELLKAQNDPQQALPWPQADSWSKWFNNHEIHALISQMEKEAVY